MKKYYICCLLILMSLYSFSCDDWNGEHVKKGQNELAYFIATYAPQPYDSSCDLNSMSTPLSVNSPVTTGSFDHKYKVTTGQSGLKYSFTTSADYPTCGAELVIYNCVRPNIYATNSLVTCDQGSYTNHISAGTQICTIPSFSNTKVLILINDKTNQFPSTPCANISFTVLP
ncbi:hypothetical protein [Leptospira stimsonii]|uniref:Lipoprotein n=1 Tax=Leptospira stimsonii TaxID=2202203 RepID=A0A8B3CJG5_9LEPT|nr:hypothetical protein [Leptospira stimsonii]RHX83231.1 hypothetical protein DLM78_22245 [Leptospira stimsonii]